MNEFRTSEEEQAFEDEASKPTTGDRKQDVLDIWFAARDFFDKRTVSPEPDVHVFELRSDTEIPSFIEWAELVNPGVGFDIPPVGAIVVAREGQFELFFPPSAVKASSTTSNGEYRRMEILRVLSHASTEKLQEIDDWVTGGRSS